MQFEVSFECIAPLSDDLEWKMIYVGSAESEQYDQELESVLVGPVEMGINRFIFQGDAPDVTRIPNDDIIGVTVVLVTCSYKEKEFIRIGYYVQNEWVNPAWNPPDGAPPEENLQQVDVNLVQRNILADKPRVTRFHIPWDDEPMAPPEITIEQQMQTQQMQQMQQMQPQQMQMEMQQQQQMQMQQGLAMQALDPNSQQCVAANKMGFQISGANASTAMDMD